MGKIRIDSALCVPENSSEVNRCETKSALTPGGREAKRLTPDRVRMDHQRKKMIAQLHLVREVSRAVSAHTAATRDASLKTLQETWRGHEKMVISRRVSTRRAGVVHSRPDKVENGSKDEVFDARVSKSLSLRICLRSHSGPPGPLAVSSSLTFCHNFLLVFRAGKLFLLCFPQSN